MRLLIVFLIQMMNQEKYLKKREKDLSVLDEPSAILLGIEIEHLLI